MAYQKQLHYHDPEQGIFGDCYRTCLAGLLDVDRDSVPHYVDSIEPAEWEKRITPLYAAWLADRGLQELAIPVYGGNVSVEEILTFQATRTSQDSRAMLNGTSATGCNHCVIIGSGKILHDPSLTDSGILGPCDDGFYWVTWLIPLEPAQ